MTIAKGVFVDHEFRDSGTRYAGAILLVEQQY